MRFFSLEKNLTSTSYTYINFNTFDVAQKEKVNELVEMRGRGVGGESARALKKKKSRKHCKQLSSFSSKR